MLVVCAANAHANTFESLESTPEAELHELLPNNTKEVQARIHMMLGRFTLDRDMDAALQHFTLAEELLVDSDLAGHSYLNVQRCLIELLQSRLAAAEEYCQTSINLAQDSGDNWALAKAYGAHATIEYQRGNLDEAVRAGRLATRYAE